MSSKIQMIGKRFGHLTVIAEGPKRDGSRETRWICKCICGKITTSIDGSNLRSGRTKSCGCYRREVLKKRKILHGLNKTRIHKLWLGMKQRCSNPNSASYERYGGRGIKVCEEWAKNFQSFYAWAMGSGYDPEAKRGECTLDRIDVNGDYCPENCRWSTAKEQGNNRRSNVVVEINGEAKTLSQWANEINIPYGIIYSRYKKGITGCDLLKAGDEP